MSKIKYVLGFVICLETKEVVLIKKNRPEFQKGFLNGIGGKIEPGEMVFAAMVRECEEECGVKTTIEDWRSICIMHCERGSIDKLSDAWEVWVFACALPFKRWNTWDTHTDEEVRVLALQGCNSENPNLLGNIPWLVGMSVDALTNKAFGAPYINYSGLSLPIKL